MQENPLTMADVVKVIADISDRYIKLLTESYSTKPIQSDVCKLNLDHLHWMLATIKTDETMHVYKRFRWLGYVQGILASKGIISVDAEREATRTALRSIEDRICF